MANKPKVKVSTYIEQQLAMCGRPQKEIAEECGYTNANIITMLKNGATKLPLNKVGVMAKALRVDPLFLLRLVMSEYTPETWETIEAIIGTENLLTDQDRMVATFANESTGGVPIDLSIEENRRVLSEAFKAVAARDTAKAQASVKRMKALPPNSRNK